MDKSELLQALAALSDDEKRAILGGSSAAAAPQSPKFSVVLDQVDEGDIPDVVNACRAGLKAIAAGEANGPAAAAQAEADAYADLVKVAPVVASGAMANGRHRGKPLAHSLSVAITYLQSPEAEAKRKAKKRKVPQPKAPGAAATAETGKGK